MKPATKILLAVLTLFMGIIVVYWGIVYRGGEEEQPVVVNDPAVAGPERPAPPPDDRDRAAGDLVPVGDGPASRPPAEPPGIGSVLAREEPVMTAMEDAADRKESEGAPPGAEVQPSTLPQDSGLDVDQTASEDASTPEATAGTAGAAEPTSGEGEPAAVSPPRRPPARAASPAYTPYAVKKGDTLSSIARAWFGNANRWDLIHAANPAIDPNDLRIGQVLRLPARDASRDRASRTVDRAGTYTVRSGDTLSSIARILLGEERHWRLIYEANRSAIGPNPDAITVGMKLIIPRRP